MESDSVCNHTSDYKITGVRFVNHDFDYRQARSPFTNESTGNPSCRNYYKQGKIKILPLG